MEALANEEVLERIGEFIDEYIQLQDGSPIPRNVQMYKDSFVMMLQTGQFTSVQNIKLACLAKQRQMIPDFLFQPIYEMEKKRKKSQGKHLDNCIKI